MVASNQATKDRTLVIERLVAAPRELVWSAWTERSHAIKWWCPKGFELSFLEMDVRPGGKWRRCMRDGKGLERWVSGVYQEIVRPERLVFTYGRDQGDTVVTITLAEAEGGTKLTLHQAEFESVEARDSHRGGWSSALERLGEYVSRRGPV
jgi:uncharacterized protein YndB with AHSA1/START domain